MIYINIKSIMQKMNFALYFNLKEYDATINLFQNELVALSELFISMKF